MMDYATIKEAAKQLGCRVNDLIALAPKNDPFYTGTPGDLAKAGWFAGIWRRFGYGRGVHLRRIHYQMISQDPPLDRPDGTPYENTEACWAYLGEASKSARYLGLVDPDAFVDRRNPDAIVHAYYGTSEPGVWVRGMWDGDMAINFPSLPELEIEGYGANYQPYHIEVWVEKTTMNDVLEPLCRRYGANLVTGAGELSITSTVDLIHRVENAGRPCRIFYVSDFDPAGYGMPVSVARKLEFFVRDQGLDLDIRLEPVALTREQVRRYRLPRTPIKESERRKGHFEDVHGEGAVELDALEALHPGELERTVERAILEFYDPDVKEQAREQRRALHEAVEKAETEALADLQEEIEQVRTDFVAAVEQVQERLTELQPQIVERLQTARDGIDLDDYPEPQAELVPESDGVLFDSTRDYVTQLERYRERRNGES